MGKNTSILDSRTRSTQKDLLIEPGKSMKMNATFFNDASRLKAPDTIKNSKSFYSAKAEIKKFVKSLPV